MTVKPTTAQRRALTEAADLAATLGRQHGIVVAGTRPDVLDRLRAAGWIEPPGRLITDEGLRVIDRAELITTEPTPAPSKAEQGTADRIAARAELMLDALGQALASADARIPATVDEHTRSALLDAGMISEVSDRITSRGSDHFTTTRGEALTRQLVRWSTSCTVVPGVDGEHDGPVAPYRSAELLHDGGARWLVCAGHAERAPKRTHHAVHLTPANIADDEALAYAADPETWENGQADKATVDLRHQAMRDGILPRPLVPTQRGQAVRHVETGEYGVYDRSENGANYARVWLYSGDPYVSDAIHPEDIVRVDLAPTRHLPGYYDPTCSSCARYVDADANGNALPHIREDGVYPHICQGSGEPRFAHPRTGLIRAELLGPDLNPMSSTAHEASGDEVARIAVIRIGDHDIVVTHDDETPNGDRLAEALERSGYLPAWGGHPYNNLVDDGAGIMLREQPVHYGSGVGVLTACGEFTATVRLTTLNDAAVTCKPCKAERAARQAAAAALADAVEAESIDGDTVKVWHLAGDRPPVPGKSLAGLDALVAAYRTGKVVLVVDPKAGATVAEWLAAGNPCPDEAAHVPECAETDHDNRGDCDGPVLPAVLTPQGHRYVARFGQSPGDTVMLCASHRGQAFVKGEAVSPVTRDR